MNWSNICSALALPRRDTKPHAKKLIHEFGGFGALPHGRTGPSESQGRRGFGGRRGCDQDSRRRAR
jgi:hypothetical protein